MARPIIYAGIGSRETPGDVLCLMRHLAAAFETIGFKLRSGGASGADCAFEEGVKHPANKAIYLPGPTFNGRQAGRNGCHDATKLPGWLKAIATVDQYHPDPRRLGQMGRKLMARNAMQVLGPNLDHPADLIVCWTPGGLLKGGTSQALRIAKDHGIPVFNLGNKEGFDQLVAGLEAIKTIALSRRPQKALETP